VRAPAAMIRPKSSTWIRSQTSMTRCTSCSTSRSPCPPPSDRGSAPSWSVSLSSRPDGLVEEQHAGRAQRGRSPRGGPVRWAARRRGRRYGPETDALDDLRDFVALA
jgi:hypothetical protein